MPFPDPPAGPARVQPLQALEPGVGPLHGSAGGIDPVLSLLLGATALGALLLVGLAVGALARRRTASYLLVAVGLAALLVRAVVGGLSLGGRLPPTRHHLIEHGLDLVVVAALFLAVAFAHAPGRPDGGEEP